MVTNSDINILRGYGVRPHQMARAKAYLQAGHSHEAAARMACRH